MIGMLNRGLLTPGLKLPKYHNLVLNLRNYLPWSTTSLIKPTRTQTHREMSKYVKPISRRAINLQTSDGVPMTYDIIYNSFEYHTITQYASAAMSILYVVFSAGNALINYDDIFENLQTTALNLWISALFLYINGGTAIISYKSPVRIYHDKNSGDYRAIFNAFKPFDIRVLEFRKGMVEKIPPPDNVTLFRYCRYKIKDQELYMFDTYFRYPSDLYGMFDDNETEQ